MYSNQYDEKEGALLKTGVFIRIDMVFFFFTCYRFISSQFHTSASRRGLEEFFDTVADIEKDKNLMVGKSTKITIVIWL